jgi:translation initiation factor 4A
MDVQDVSANTVVGDRFTPPAPLKVCENFDEMSLPDNLLRGIYAYGFEKPSAIQQRGVVPIKEGRDILAQAQSGTGKTGTFVIGSLCRVDPGLNQVQVLVIAPVRELAQQIETVARGIGSYLPLNVHCVMTSKPLRRAPSSL